MPIVEGTVIEVAVPLAAVVIELPAEKFVMPGGAIQISLLAVPELTIDNVFPFETVCAEGKTVS